MVCAADHLPRSAVAPVQSGAPNSHSLAPNSLKGAVHNPDNCGLLLCGWSNLDKFYCQHIIEKNKYGTVQELRSTFSHIKSNIVF